MASPPREPWLVRQVRGKWWVGAVLVALSFLGFALVWGHWTGQGWPVRGAELGGTQKAGMLREARDWRPSVGMLLLAAGGLLGWVVSAGWLARRMMCAAGWTLIALIIVHLVENWLLTETVHAGPSTPGPVHLNSYSLWLQGTSFAGEALLPIAGLVALLGAVAALNRLATRFARYCRKRLAPLAARFARYSSKWLEDSDGPLDTRGADSLIEDAHGDRANWRGNSVLPLDRVGAVAALGCLAARFASYCRKGLVTLKRRAAKSMHYCRERLGDIDGPLDTLGADSLIEDEHGDRANWRGNSVLPLDRVRKIEKAGPRRLGICLSGGGIRSAAFSLGALQALQGVHSRGKLAAIHRGRGAPLGSACVNLCGGGGRGSLRACPVSLRLMMLRGFVLRTRGSGP